MTNQEHRGQSVIGTVVSDKMQKSCVVLVERLTKHPKYGKYIKKSTKLHAHDEMSCNVGDKVKIRETKPRSKTKTWEVVEIISSAA